MGLQYHPTGSALMMGAVKDKLGEGTLGKLDPFFKHIGYRGPVALNTICNEKGIFCLSIKTQLMYDATDALLDALLEPVGDLLFEVAAGTKNELKVGRDMTIAVRLSVPPWPYNKPNGMMYGMPIVGLTPEQVKHLSFRSVYFDPRDQVYKLSGGDGVVLKVFSNGRSMEEARYRAYGLIERISLPYKQYRTDVGDRVDKDVKTLRTLEYLNA
jgi:phosphoribosylamine--glycine ligase